MRSNAVITKDDVELIKEWANCRHADVDESGDVWIEDPQHGHWLSFDAIQRFIDWRGKQ